MAEIEDKSKLEPAKKENGIIAHELPSASFEVFVKLNEVSKENS